MSEHLHSILQHDMIDRAHCGQAHPWWSGRPGSVAGTPRRASAGSAPSPAAPCWPGAGAATAACPAACLQPQYCEHGANLEHSLWDSGTRDRGSSRLVLCWSGARAATAACLAASLRPHREPVRMRTAYMQDKACYTRPACCLKQAEWHCFLCYWQTLYVPMSEGWGLSRGGQTAQIASRS